LTADAGGQKQLRELYPINSYYSQGPCRVHFGLADTDKVERLTIQWPSGQLQVLTDLCADRHIVVEEGKTGAAAITTVVPGSRILP
jgi:hypothetical protein